MEFKQALELMKQGASVKRPHWSGYWRFENGSIKMYCKDGRILDIRESEDILYTLEAILANDWVIATAENSKLLAGEIITTFSFGEAVRELKNGKRVARKAWGNNKIYLVFVTKGYFDVGISITGEDCKELSPWIGMRTVGAKFIPWTATQADILADDWYIVQ